MRKEFLTVFLSEVRSTIPASSEALRAVMELHRKHREDREVRPIVVDSIQIGDAAGTSVGVGQQRRHGRVICKCGGRTCSGCREFVRWRQFWHWMQWFQKESLVSLRLTSQGTTVMVLSRTQSPFVDSDPGCKILSFQVQRIQHEVYASIREGAVEKRIEVCSRGVSAQDEVRQVRGWKLLMLLPRMVLHRGPRRFGPEVEIGGAVRILLIGRMAVSVGGQWGMRPTGGSKQTPESPPRAGQR